MTGVEGIDWDIVVAVPRSDFTAPIVKSAISMFFVILAALALLACSVALTTRMHHQWQLILLWGILVGSGTGVTSMVLAAIVATRWFETRR